MNRHQLEIYIELYKRKTYKSIPIGKYADGNYFFMTSKQITTLELINDETTTHVGYGGSARSGKSIIECTAIILDCLSYNNIAWGLARKELTTLKRTVLLTLFKQLQFYGLTESEYCYNQQLNKLSFKNGSEIFFIDTAFKPSDPLNTRFGGFELTRCACDESNETEVSVVNKLFERTGWRHNDTYNLKRKLFECFNPDKNHVYERYYVPFRDNTEPEYKRFIQALPSDNPNPAVKEWIDDIIKTGDTATIERQIYGNFDYDDDPSKLCEWDAICDLFSNDFVKPTGLRYISADLAMQGRDKFIGSSWDGLVCSIDLDRNKTTGKENEELLRQLAIKKAIPFSRIIADSDGLGAYLGSYMPGIKEFHGNAKSTDAIEYVNIKAECGFKLAELINKREIKINCTEEQKKIIKSELSICLKRDNVYKDDSRKKLISKEIMKNLLGHSPDYMDSLLMRMYFELKKEHIRIIG